MKLYHGSNTAGIHILEPRLADHDRPYVYLTTIDVVSAFYICNAVEKPYYWFPYGFNENNVPIYHELYPNAFKEISQNRKGYLYEVDAKESQIIPFKSIPCARLGIEPLEVVDFIEISDAYAYFMECVDNGKLEIGKFENKSEKELENWYKMILGVIQEKNMKDTPNCSYAEFVKNKFPFIWYDYINNNSKHFG